MAEPTREELENKAVSLGLAGAETYANKEVIKDAIARVEGGESAATVDNEFQNADPAGDDDQGAGDDPETLNSGLDPEVIEDENTDDELSDDDGSEEAGAEQPAKEKRYVKYRNNGHATKFDEFGRPLFKG